MASRLSSAIKSGRISTSNLSWDKRRRIKVPSSSSCITPGVVQEAPERTTKGRGKEKGKEERKRKKEEEERKRKKERKKEEKEEKEVEEKKNSGRRER